MSDLNFDVFGDIANVAVSPFTSALGGILQPVGGLIGQIVSIPLQILDKSMLTMMLPFVIGIGGIAAVMMLMDRI